MWINLESLSQQFLVDYPGEIVRLSCAKCGRAEQYRKRALISCYGTDICLPELLEEIAQCERRGQTHDACMVHYIDLIVLKKIGKHFGVDPWLESTNDYLVLNDAGRIIGRIVKRACSPNGRPWVWTITVPSFFNNHGYSETREQAMVDFKAHWPGN